MKSVLPRQRNVTCTNSHALSLTTYKALVALSAGYADGFVCDTCFASGDRQESCYHCTICKDFDMCLDCALIDWEKLTVENLEKTVPKSILLTKDISDKLDAARKNNNVIELK